MKDLFNIDFNDRNHKISELRNTHENYKSFFEEAIEETLLKIQDKIKKSADKISELQDKISDYPENNNGIPTNDDLELYDQQMNYEYDRYISSLHLNSLSEMKIVYLFKNLEISMKVLIKTAYPEIEVKSFFEWEKMISFFKSRKMEISKLTGYNESVDLRKANNNIKHSGELNEDLKKIKEFENKTEFDSHSLELFYQRIKPKIELFQKELSELVISDLFEFDNDRLTNLAKEYVKRMEKEKVKQFSELLLST